MSEERKEVNMRPERKEDFPCLLCGKVLYREGDDEGQPRDGVVVYTHGNYGSRAFDDLHGEFLAFNICDDCLRQRGAEGSIYISQSAVNVWVEGAICGVIPVDRPYVPWHPGMQPSDEKYHVEISEIIEGTWPKRIRWNDKGEGNWPDVLAADWFDRHPEELAEWKQELPEHVERIDAIMADWERRCKERMSGLNLDNGVPVVSHPRPNLH